MQGVSVRSITLHDVDSVLGLIHAYWQHEAIAGFDPVRLRDQLRDFLIHSVYGCGWLVEDAGATVGYLLCTFVYSFEHGGRMAEIDEFFVAQSHRGRGLGRRLLASAREELSGRGFTMLQMQVAEGNEKARSFYARQGFVEKSGCRLWLAPLP